MKNWQKTMFVILLLPASCTVFGQGMETELDDMLGSKPAEPLFKPSMKDVNLSIPLKGNDAVEVNFKLNHFSVLKFTMVPEKGKKIEFEAKPGAQTLKHATEDDKGNPLPETNSMGMVLRDQGFGNQMMNVAGCEYPVRPSFYGYPEDMARKLNGEWDQYLPNALEYTMRLTLYNTPSGVRMDLDGRYWKTYRNFKLKELQISGGRGPEIKHKVFRNQYNTGDWESLYIAGAGWGGVMRKAKTSLKPGHQVINGIPMDVAVPEQSADLSTTYNYFGLKDDTIDIYLSRNSFSRNPASCMLSVPNGHYYTAYILFALDPNPKKDRAFCIRMSRFNGAPRGSGFAYTDVTLPKEGEPMPENIREVGTVELAGKTIPLYLGEFPIYSGDIADIVSNDPMPSMFWLNNRRDALDFELLNRRRNWISVYGTDINYPHRGQKSAVNVFGATLKRCPMQFEAVTKQVCNIFKDDEKQETGVKLTAVKDSTSILTWKIYDAYKDNLLDTRTAEVTLKNGETKEVICSLTMPDAGHYNVDFELTEKGAEKPYFLHHAAFAILGPDTRLAKPSESPFGIWWFQGGTHYCPSDPEFVLNILNRAGIRHTSFSTNDPKEVAARKKYQVTLQQFGWREFPGTERDAVKKEQDMTDEEIMASLHERYDQDIKNNPDTKMVLLWHESFGGDHAEEIYDRKQKPGYEMWALRQIKCFSRFFRENYPDIKIVMGNSGTSLRCVSTLLSNGIPADSWDYVGIEALGLAKPPEMLWLRTPASSWLIEKVGKAYGLELKTTSCFESTSRRGDALGWKKQAELYTRDGLVGLAFGYISVALSGMPYSDAYCQSVYGGGDGFISRDLYPRPFFTSYATLTKVFDQIDCKPRVRDTGALTTYAVGFARKRGDFAYALWTPKNEAEVKVTFDKEVELTRVAFFGKETKEKGKEFTFIASGTPQYFTAPADPMKIEHVRAVMNLPAGAEIRGKDLTDVKQVKNWAAAGIPGVDESAVRTPGEVEVKAVKDDEMGDCLEFTLKRDKPCPEVMLETSYWRFTEPVEMPGTPDAVAVLVKGDGGWGEILFDLQDADGHVFRTGARGGCGNDALLNIHFKGWNWIYHHLNIAGLRDGWKRTQHLGSTGFFRGDTNSTGKGPIKIIGIYIGLRRYSLNPSKMMEAPGIIRIKQIGGMYRPEYQPLPADADKKEVK